MKSDVAYALDILGLRPPTWDIGGWAKLSQKHRLPSEIISMEDEKLPASRKEFLELTSEYKASLKTAAITAKPTLNADDYGSNDWQKEYEAWIESCERAFFPAYIDTVNLLTKKLLIDNFKFKYAQDGTPIVYSRVQGAEGTIWQEVGDSSCPFSSLQGELRLELEKTLIATTNAKEVDVFYKKNDQTQYATNIPYYKLYLRFKDEFFSTITGKPDNIRQVQADFLDTIDSLKRQHNGDLTRGEIEGGLKRVNEMLTEMDGQLNTYTFLYDPDFTPADLTNDPTVDAYCYFNLDQLHDGDTPDFDGFLDAVRPECRGPLMAAVYATVFAKSSLNQYIWIHGEGGDGKSSFLNALRKYLGPRLCCSLGQTINSDFGLEDALGKRMVILSDVKTGLSVKGTLIHNLTGHDPISINRKNKPIITTVLNPIVWIASNESPNVNFDNRNESRRCMYIKMQEPSVKTLRKFYVTNEKGEFILDPNGHKINNGYDLTGGLVREMPAILYKCKAEFEKLCPSPYSVIVPPVEQMALAIENCVDMDADALNVYIQEAFEFNDKGHMLKLTEINEAIEEVRKLHGEKSLMNNFMKGDLKRLLLNKYGCKNKKIDGIRYLEGIRPHD